MGGRLARNGNSEPRQPLLSLSAAPCGRNNHKYVSRSRIIIAQGTQGQIIASRRVSGRSDPPIPCPPLHHFDSSSFNTSDSVLSPPEASSTLPTLLVNNRVPNLAAGPAHDAPTLAMLFDGRNASAPARRYPPCRASQLYLIVLPTQPLEFPLQRPRATHTADKRSGHDHNVHSMSALTQHTATAPSDGVMLHGAGGARVADSRSRCRSHRDSGSGNTATHQ